MNRWIAVGGFSGFVAVAMGAFGAHALARILDDKALAVYHTGAQYQIYHALALLAVGLLELHSSTQGPVPTTLSAAGWCFTIGTVLFSGSLYALALTGNRAFGPITPIGGLLFLSGWTALAWAGLRAGSRG